MKCPNCGTESLDDALECPSCRLIFAKFRQKHSPASASAPPPKSQEKKPPEAPPASDSFFPGWADIKKPRTPDELFLRWMIVFVSVGFFVFLIGVLMRLSSIDRP